ncbi:hypothetical protein D3C75_501840 [compost metagenome]
MLARRARLHVEQLEVDSMIVHVHLGDTDLHLVADAEHLGGAFADERHMAFVEVVIIVRQRTKTNQTLDCIIKLNEHSEAGHTADHCLEFLTDLIQHILSLLQLLCVAFCLNRHTFTLGRLLCDIRHPAGQIFMPFLSQRAAVLDHLTHHPVNDKVGITADR